MSPQEINRRKAAVKAADAMNKIEGVPVSDEAVHLSKQWVRGEISGDEMKSTLIAKYAKPNTSQEHRHV